MRSAPSTIALAALLLVACSDDGGMSARVCEPRAASHGLPWLDGGSLPGLPGGSGATTPGGSALVAVPSFGDNPGALAMYAHAPANVRPGGAVVVALHGCTQTASAYAGAGWNALADASGFVVVYPEQSAANDVQRCFRWWDLAHTTRDRGEAKSIKSMVDWAKAKYGLKDAYVTGLSAGGAMTAVMLAAYPDVFAAGAIMSGLPYGCAKSKMDAYSCMSGREQSADAWAAALPALARSNAPRVSIWHGDADYVVRPSNAEQLVRQWARANGLDDEKGETKSEAGAKHTLVRDPKGAVRVEQWRIPGMGHGVALDPKRGCGAAGAYLLDEGLCSTAKVSEFFGLSAAGGSGAPGAAGGGPNPCE